MALVKIDSPSDAPLVVADWYKVNSVLQAIGNALGSGSKVVGDKIQRGSVIFFAGSWYIADSDTTIIGTASDYVKLTNTAGTISAIFSVNITGVTWNKQYNGWYDATGNMYLFDEIKAYGSGLIDAIHTVDSVILSVNLSKLLSRVISTNNLARFFRIDNEQTLTGIGNWTVPAGVFWIDVELVGPGEDGSQGNGTASGRGGTSGAEIRTGYAVTPGQVLAYSITTTSTIFNGTTAVKGGGRLGGSGGGGNGGEGGGYRGGSGGLNGGDGGSAVAGYGGGGGGGARRDYNNTNGGSGAVGSVKIR